MCWVMINFASIIQVIRQGDRVRVDWSEVFNDGQDCVEVDFIIKVHPKNDLSAVRRFLSSYNS